jgi:hypothetical protein
MNRGWFFSSAIHRTAATSCRNAGHSLVEVWYNASLKHEALGGSTPATASGLKARAWITRQLLELGAVKDSLQRQVAAYKRVDDAWNRVQQIHRMAYEQLGLQIDSAHVVDGIEISDELRGIYALLKNATGEFKAACIAFDEAVNVHKVLSATPQ